MHHSQEKTCFKDPAEERCCSNGLRDNADDDAAVADDDDDDDEQSGGGEAWQLHRYSDSDDCRYHDKNEVDDAYYADEDKEEEEEEEDV